MGRESIMASVFAAPVAAGFRATAVGECSTVGSAKFTGGGSPEFTIDVLNRIAINSVYRANSRREMNWLRAHRDLYLLRAHRKVSRRVMRTQSVLASVLYRAADHSKELRPRRGEFATKASAVAVTV